MESPKTKKKKSTNKIWLRRVLYTLAALVLIPLFLFTVGWFNRDTILEVIQDWYKENNNGTLVIGEVNASFISGFPKIGFTLNNIVQTNNDTVTDKQSSIKIAQAKLTIGAANLLSGDIIFDKIELKNATISSNVVGNRGFEYHEQLKLDKVAKSRRDFELPEWINKEKVKFKIRNVQFISRDTILNKYFNLTIHRLEGNYKKLDKLLGEADFDVTVDNLGFNTKKGSFFNGARVSGSPNFIIDLDNNQIKIEKFLLNVDEQTFSTIADFDVYNDNYLFNLQNKETDFIATRALLPDSISAKIKDYNLLNPIETEFKILGEFAYGSNPDIYGTFTTENNALVISDYLQLENVNMHGNITNDIYETDSLRLTKKSKKDIKVSFKAIAANYKDITIEAKDAYYLSSAETKNSVKADLRLNGSNEALAQAIRTDNFDFKGGNFSLTASIKGNADYPHQILNNAVGKFILQNTQVVLKKNGLQLPVETINLRLNNQLSKLEELTINLPNGERITLTGDIHNASSILSKNPVDATTSTIFLNSPGLNINEVINLATRFMPESNSEVQDRKNLHQTLSAIYNQFRPQFVMRLNTLKFNDITIDDVNSNLELINPETLRLYNFSFSYHGAETTLKGNLRVPKPTGEFNEPYYINAQAESMGELKIFKELFDVELFRIDSGDFKFNGNVTGNINRLRQFLYNANGDFSLTNTKLNYPPADLDIEIDSLSLVLNNSDVTLNEFELEIGELYPVKINGNIQKYPSFLLDEENKGSVFLKLNAPYVDGENWSGVLSRMSKDSSEANVKNGKGLHQVFKDLNSFNPTIKLQVDSLNFKNIITENLNAKAAFENDSILKLNYLNLDYKETKAQLVGMVNAHISDKDSINQNPFNFDFSLDVQGKTSDLNDYLQTVNFVFTSGDFQFKSNYSGQSDDIGIINSEDSGILTITDAVVDYIDADIQIPIDNLNLQLNNDVATLNRLDINLPGKSSIELSGSIENFTEFINNELTNSTHQSEFKIYSPYLSSTDVKKFLAKSKRDKSTIENAPMDVMKFQKALNNINASFNPTVIVKLDSIEHNDLYLRNFYADLDFNADGNLELKETTFDFYEGQADFNVKVGLSENDILPVEISMSAADINLKTLLSKLDYFGDEDLKKADNIEGNINYNLDVIGAIRQDGNIDFNTLNGTIKVKLENLELINYQPIMESIVLLKKERFKELKFRPIELNLKIENGEIIIPRTEVQSTAIQVFVEGRLKLDDYLNLWLSVPWKNLKRNDGQSLPEKTSYTEAGSKFYLQILKDPDNLNERKRQLKVKFRLSNRKLRKELESSPD